MARPRLGVSIKQSVEKNTAGALDNTILNAYSSFKTFTNSKPLLFPIWSRWSRGDVFPTDALLDGITSRGATPMIFWESVVAQSNVSRTTAEWNEWGHASIIAGKHDAYLTTWANAANTWNEDLILRFDQEVNGHWAPWSKGAKYVETPRPPIQYRLAFRYIANHIGTIAPKVKFHYCPIYRGWSRAYGEFRKWYPDRNFSGNKLIDYVGFDVYDKSGGKISLEYKSRPSINACGRIAPGIPILIGEFGSAQAKPGSSNNAGRAKWLNGYKYLKPTVWGGVYFHLDLAHNWKIAGTKMKQAYANRAPA